MRTILLDGDILVFTSASSSENSRRWSDGIWTLDADEDAGFRKIDAGLAHMKEKLDADRILIALTDDHNYRKDILPSYKENRGEKRKPMLIPILRDYITEEYGAVMKPGLEGDDLLGIWATHPTLVQGEKIIWSIDKDMRTIPCSLYQGDDVMTVSEEEADRWHLIQSLAGDATDNYGGCPGIGMLKAAEIVDDPHLMVKETRVLKSGPNAGKESSRWVKGAPCTQWEAIVSHYVKAGLCEAEALTQARCARILRAEDYDFKKKEPILWIPQ